MSLFIRFRSGLRNLLRKPQIESQLDEEVRAYVEIVTDERIAAGMPAEEARRSALADFGGVEQGDVLPFGRLCPLPRSE